MSSDVNWHLATSHLKKPFRTGVISEGPVDLYMLVGEAEARCYGLKLLSTLYDWITMEHARNNLKVRMTVFIVLLHSSGMQSHE